MFHIDLRVHQAHMIGVLAGVWPACQSYKALNLLYEINCESVNHLMWALRSFQMYYCLVQGLQHFPAPILCIFEIFAVRHFLFSALLSDVVNICRYTLNKSIPTQYC